MGSISIIMLNRNGNVVLSYVTFTMPRSLFLLLVCWEFLLWMDIEVFQIFFNNYWNNHIIFFFHSVNVVYHLWWFAYLESSVYCKIKSHNVDHFITYSWTQLAGKLLRMVIPTLSDITTCSFLFLAVSLTVSLCQDSKVLVNL